MTGFVYSADGTRIAFDRSGEGEPLILVAGMLCDRSVMRDLARVLSRQFQVFNLDRRGRGESGNTPPYAVGREVEDIGALIAAAGGRAALYGHSSGAGLALNAAAAGLPVSRLVLHEPPYGPDDEMSKNEARAFAVSIKALLAEDRRVEAIATFYAAAGVPPEMAGEMSRDPARIAMAQTMRYDFEVMGELSRGGIIPEDMVRGIHVPTLVLAGGESPDFFRDTAARLVELLPDGRLGVLAGQDHGAPAEFVAPAVAEFLCKERAAA